MTGSRARFRALANIRLIVVNVIQCCLSSEEIFATEDAF